MRLTGVAVFFLLVVAYVSCQTCTYTDPNTDYEYDLSPLTSDNSDYIVDVPEGTDAQTDVGYKISLNICRSVLTNGCSAKGGSQCDACQQWPLDDPGALQYNAPLGTVGQTSFSQTVEPGTDGEGLTMKFAGFDSTMQINFICNTGAGKGSPAYESKPTGNSFLLKWKSKNACATNGKAIADSGSSSGGGLSGGSIMMIIILVVVVVYLTAGIAYQKLKNHAEGLDLIPNKDFWTSLPGLVKDGVMFIVNKIRGTSGNTYSSVK